MTKLRSELCLSRPALGRVLEPSGKKFWADSPGLHGWDMLWERARVEGIESFLGGTGGGLWLSTRGGGGGAAAADELPRRGGRGGGVLRISGCSRGSEGNCMTLVWLGLELGSVNKVKWKLADIIHAVKNQGLIMPWRNILVKVTAVACFTVGITIVHVIQFEIFGISILLKSTLVSNLDSGPLFPR